ncbi:MAG TPA: hypothetical protein VF590_06145, partial [Isosphaeraceae bacterium]
ERAFNKTARVRIQSLSILGAVFFRALARKSLSEAQQSIKLARRVIAETARMRTDSLSILGAALYRSGQFDAAFRTLNDTERDNASLRSAWTWLFLAMTHHRLAVQTRQSDGWTRPWLG